MKTKSSTIILITLLAVVLLSACQMRRPAAANNRPAPAQAAVRPTGVGAAPTQAPARAQAPTATQKPAQDPEKARAAAAEQAARAYFAAVAGGSSGDAAGLLSAYSLMVFQMTRGDAAAALQAQKMEGAGWSDLEVLEVRPFDAQTYLVHVTYAAQKQAQATAPATLTPTPTAAKETKETKGPGETKEPEATKTPAAETRDELWPMRLESGAWRYNWNNLIDFRTLGQGAQTMNGITLLPVQMNRYTDRVQLVLLAQNRTNEAVVFGQKNETLGAFHFGAQVVVAEKTQWVLNPLRSIPAATLEAKGLFEQFPDSIDIRQWNTANVKPWYTFQLQ